MRRNLFWLSDEQWRRIEPLLPTDVRGKERADDRRVISGILHVLKSGCRWCDCPPEYGPPTTIYNRFVRWARARHLGAIVPRACRARPIDRDADDRLHAHQGAPLGLGRKRGEQKQAIGRSRGGRNTKIHAIADAKGRLLSILLTGGEAHDCPPAQRLIRRTKAAKKLLGDKAYDSAELRQWLKESRHQARHPQHFEPQAALQLRQEILQAATPHRECLLPPQGLPTHRHPLRQARPKLPRLRLPRRCYRMVDFMSLGPSRRRPGRLRHAVGRRGGRNRLCRGVATRQRCAMVEVGEDRRRAQGAGPDLLQPGASHHRAGDRQRQVRGGVAARRHAFAAVSRMALHMRMTLACHRTQ